MFVFANVHESGLDAHEGLVPGRNPVNVRFGARVGPTTPGDGESDLA